MSQIVTSAPVPAAVRAAAVPTTPAIIRQIGVAYRDIEMMPMATQHFMKFMNDSLDELVRGGLVRYRERSIFSRADWDDPAFTSGMRDITPDTAVRMVLGQVRYILHDPQISRSRRMLTIEQFRNPELSELQTQQNYTDVMRYFTGLVGFLISRGKLGGGDQEIMAAQLCLPVSVWINLCDREPAREEEIMGLIERHIRQFFAIYGAGAHD